MPLYEYRCESCQHQFEVIQKFSDPPIEKCPGCGTGPVVKLLSSPAIQFKGSGWYITDYARKDSAKPASDGKTDGKSETKTDSSSATTGTDSTTATPKPAASSDSKS